MLSPAGANQVFHMHACVTMQQLQGGTVGEEEGCQHATPSMLEHLMGYLLTLPGHALFKSISRAMMSQQNHPNNRWQHAYPAPQEVNAFKLKKVNDKPCQAGIWLSWHPC